MDIYNITAKAVNENIFKIPGQALCCSGEGDVVGWRG